MSDSALSRRYQPLFAWLLLLLVLLVLAFFVVLPAVMKSQELTDQIESGYKRLDKMRQVAQATPQLTAEYERVRQQGLDKLFQLELKLEMLQTEKLLLDYEVIKTMRVLENTGSK